MIEEENPETLVGLAHEWLRLRSNQELIRLCSEDADGLTLELIRRFGAYLQVTSTAFGQDEFRRNGQADIV